MAMRALETERMISVGNRISIRQVDIFSEDEEPTSVRRTDMDGFMNTFDQAVTAGEHNNWEVWAKRNKVDQREVGCEEALMVCFLGMSPHIRDPFNRCGLVEATYQVHCHSHGGEAEYLDFLFFLLSNKETL